MRAIELFQMVLRGGIKSNSAIEGIMATYSETLIPRRGIPLNIGIAVGVGVLVAVLGEGIERGISTGVLFGIFIGFLLQEIILVQILSREANINFQYRVLEGHVTSTNRFLLLFGPLGILLVIGFGLALFNGQTLDLSTIARIALASAIVMFGVDPLFGLVDKGVLAIFGAAVVYIIILQAGFDGYGGITEKIAPLVGSPGAISVASAVIAYLLLSTRWTYYRLFCFNQINDLWKAFADTGLPLVLVLLPYFPQFVKMLEAIFLGI
jgi:hypothetical protein